MESEQGLSTFTQISCKCLLLVLSKQAQYGLFKGYATHRTHCNLFSWRMKEWMILSAQRRTMILRC